LREREGGGEEQTTLNGRSKLRAEKREKNLVNAFLSPPSLFRGAKVCAGAGVDDVGSGKGAPKGCKEINGGARGRLYGPVHHI